MCEQIKENGIYAVFDKSNSKEEITQKINERENQKWTKIQILSNTIKYY